MTSASPPAFHLPGPTQSPDQTDWVGHGCLGMPAMGGPPKDKCDHLSHDQPRPGSGWFILSVTYNVQICPAYFLPGPCMFFQFLHKRSLKQTISPQKRKHRHLAPHQAGTRPFLPVAAAHRQIQSAAPEVLPSLQEHPNKKLCSSR